MSEHKKENSHSCFGNTSIIEISSDDSEEEAVQIVEIFDDENVVLNSHSHNNKEHSQWYIKDFGRSAYCDNSQQNSSCSSPQSLQSNHVMCHPSYQNIVSQNTQQHLNPPFFQNAPHIREPNLNFANCSVVMNLSLGQNPNFTPPMVQSPQTSLQPHPPPQPAQMHFPHQLFVSNPQHPHLTGSHHQLLPYSASNFLHNNVPPSIQSAPNHEISVMHPDMPAINHNQINNPEFATPRRRKQHNPSRKPAGQESVIVPRNTNVPKKAAHLYVVNEPSDSEGSAEDEEDESAESDDLGNRMPYRKEKQSARDVGCIDTPHNEELRSNGSQSSRLIHPGKRKKGELPHAEGRPPAACSGHSHHDDHTYSSDFMKSGSAVHELETQPETNGIIMVCDKNRNYIQKTNNHKSMKYISNSGRNGSKTVGSHTVRDCDNETVDLTAEVDNNLPSCSYEDPERLNGISKNAECSTRLLHGREDGKLQILYDFSPKTEEKRRLYEKGMGIENTSPEPSDENQGYKSRNMCWGRHFFVFWRYPETFKRHFEGTVEIATHRICGKRFKVEYHLLRVYETYRCDVCEERKWFNDICKGASEEHDTFCVCTFKCELCGIHKFERSSDLWNHSKSHIQPNNSIICGKCNISFVGNIFLEYHKIKCRKNETYMCMLNGCGAISTVKMIKAHLVYHIKNEIVCRMCGHYYSENSIKSHEKICGMPKKKKKRGPRQP